MRNVLEIAQEGIWDWHVPSGRVTHNARWYQDVCLYRVEHICLKSDALCTGCAAGTHHFPNAY